MLSLTYISRARRSRSQKPTSMAQEICRAAAVSNQQTQITGALIFTTAHFAQILEGPADAVDRTMRKIRADDRHDQIRVLRTDPIAARRFPEWSMAYAGGPVALDKFIARALADGEALAVHSDLLCRLITQFAISRQAMGKLRGARDVDFPGATAALPTGDLEHRICRILP